MRNNFLKAHKFLTMAAGLFALSVLTPQALADGTENLGTPGIAIASGTGVIVAGVGLSLGQPDDISFNVPGGATVEQVLLYWEGQDLDVFTGDDDIIVNLNLVTGIQIGGPIFWLDGGVSTTYRADITGLGLVGPGANILTVEGLSFTNFTNGAGVLVIIDDGSLLSNIEIRDGNDLAFFDWPAPMTTTVAQTFTFPVSSAERTGALSMFFSAVSGTASSGGTFRPTAIDITVGAVTVTHDNLLDSFDGQEWDTLVLPVTIPAGETMVTVQAFSVDNLSIGGLPASLTWNAAALSVPPPPNGGGEGCTPGFWKQTQHLGLWTTPFTPETLFSDVFENAFPGLNLLEVVSLHGGGLNRLGAHTVAALLNAASPDVDYDLSVTEVIDAFNDVFPGTNSQYNALKNTLVDLNEQGCPIS